MKRAAITLGIGLLVLSPLARPKGWDDFPISSYPMFSRGDINGVHTLSHAIVVYADGHRRPATPSQVGSPEPMVATAIVNQAINAGSAASLCALIAKNINDPDAVTVEVLRSDFNAQKYFKDGIHEPDARVVHASCPVKR